jgi:hypothetical protein
MFFRILGTKACQIKQIEKQNKYESNPVHSIYFYGRKRIQIQDGTTDF